MSIYSSCRLGRGSPVQCRGIDALVYEHGVVMANELRGSVTVEDCERDASRSLQMI